MDTKKFRTQTNLLVAKDNKKVDGYWEIALDLGYSAVKLFAPNSYGCFPAYARKINSEPEFTKEIPDEYILLKDLMTNELWLIGQEAQNQIPAGDTSDSESSLYGRNRWQSPMVKAQIKAGLGIAMIGNEYGSIKPSDEIFIQTGLPERYLNDEEDVKDAIAGDYIFELKVGKSGWQEFSFTIKSENIDVMSQPKGTLFSACIDKDGNFRSDAKDYLQSSVLILDPGFGTLDLFSIVNGTVPNPGETFSDLGMKRVLQETCKKIKNTYKVNVEVPSIQKNLETGMVRYEDRKTFTAKEYPFGNLLKEACNEVCEEALERITSAVNIFEYKYLIITGGTGQVWLESIRDKFKNISTLRIINGNQNDNLPFIYNNVRGYYMYRAAKLKPVNK